MKFPIACERRFRASVFPGWSQRDASSGINVNATINDVDSENTIVIAISLNITPAIPGTNRIGTKTARVVRVDATIAVDTCLVPS